MRGFQFAPEQIAANQISLSDLGVKVPKRTMKVPKRIVKSWVWLMTIRFGLAMTMGWIKSTLTHLSKRAVRYKCEGR